MWWWGGGGRHTQKLWLPHLLGFNHLFNHLFSSSLFVPKMLGGREWREGRRERAEGGKEGETGGLGWNSTQECANQAAASPSPAKPPFVSAWTGN